MPPTCDGCGATPARNVDYRGEMLCDDCERTRLHADEARATAALEALAAVARAALGNASPADVLHVVQTVVERDEAPTDELAVHAVHATERKPGSLSDLCARLCEAERQRAGVVSTA